MKLLSKDFLLRYASSLATGVLALCTQGRQVTPASHGHQCLQAPQGSDGKGCDDLRICWRCSDAHLPVPGWSGETGFILCLCRC